MTAHCQAVKLMTQGHLNGMCFYPPSLPHAYSLLFGLHYASVFGLYHIIGFHSFQLFYKNQSPNGIS